MEVHTAELIKRVADTEEAYKGEIAKVMSKIQEEQSKIQSKYTTKLHQLNLEVQLYLSQCVQKLCDSIGIKYTPGSGADIQLVTNTLPLGVAYLMYTAPEEEASSDGDTIEIVPVPRGRLN